MKLMIFGKRRFLILQGEVFHYYLKYIIHYYLVVLCHFLFVLFSYKAKNFRNIDLILNKGGAITIYF